MSDRLRNVPDRRNTYVNELKSRLVHFRLELGDVGRSVVGSVCFAANGIRSMLEGGHPADNQPKTRIYAVRYARVIVFVAIRDGQSILYEWQRVTYVRRLL